MTNLLNTEESSEICKKCGSFCCKYVIETIPKDDPNVDRIVEFWDVRKSNDFLSKELDDAFLFIIDERCPKLGDDDLCTIYEHRPTICREFPSGGENNKYWWDHCELIRVLYDKEQTTKKEIMQALKI